MKEVKKSRLVKLPKLSKKALNDIKGGRMAHVDDCTCHFTENSGCINGSGDPA